MSRLCVFYIKPRPTKRWVEGDQWIISFLKRLLNKKTRISSLEIVHDHLCKGLAALKVDFIRNPSFNSIRPDDIVIMLGHGRNCLKGYTKPNPVIAGISLMSHPSEWPELFGQYPVKVYLQHSQWTVDIYKRYFGDRCDIWPTGIDTAAWRPDGTEKDIDVLIYDKIMIDHSKKDTLLEPIRRYLDKKQLKTAYIRYGNYLHADFKDLLKRSRSMVFMVEHESQGIAYQEALSMDVPVFAWDQGKWMDPNLELWGEKDVPASAVPYFDERCGERFNNIDAFYQKFEGFWNGVKEGRYHPRDYVLENLTLEKSAAIMLDIVKKWTKNDR